MSTISNLPKSMLACATWLLAAQGALATETLSAGQLEAAARVFTGGVDCELNRKVSLQPIEGSPGHFKLTYNRVSYTLVPQETTTGAVRLEDRKAGIVWLQIPAKSMLMNARLGQRMVDSCQHAGQRAAVAPADSTMGFAAAPGAR